MNDVEKKIGEISNKYSERYDGVAEATKTAQVFLTRSANYASSVTCD